MKKSISGANGALLLLLGINLLNYIDRQILAALEPDIRASFFATGDVNAMTKTGLLGDAFFVTYMISAPILGLLADRFSRWMIVGSHLGWRWAFYLVAPPGLLLGLLCFWQRDPRVTAHHLVQESPRRSLRDYLRLFRTRSYLINCIAQTLMTFVTGGLGYWVSAY